MDNIVKEAHKHGLTIKQERFARAVADGSTQCDAATQAGYLSPTRNKEKKPSFPSRLVRQEKISTRINELIAAQDFEKDAENTWSYLFQVDPRELKLGSPAWSNVIDKKLKAIEQIAKLGGWEPKNIEETRKLIIKGNIRDMLPTDTAHEDISGSTIINNSMSGHGEDEK